MSISPTMLRCAMRPCRQIRVMAPGNRPASTWLSRKRGMRASLSSENPASIAMAMVILSLAMNGILKNWPAMPLHEAHARLTAPGARFETTEVNIRGIATPVWKYVPATAAEAFVQARAHGEREFLVYQDERVSFEGFARASLHIAAMLKDRGLRKGDRVALVMRNLPEWPVIFMGALLAGAIVVPLNAWWNGAELAYGILDCGARFVFADAERLARLKDQPPFVEHVFVARAANPPLG